MHVDYKFQITGSNLITIKFKADFEASNFWGETEYKISEIQCKGDPTSALITAKVTTVIDQPIEIVPPPSSNPGHML